MPSDNGAPDDAPPDLSDAAEEWPVVGSEDLYRGAAPFAVRSDRLRHRDHSDEEAFDRVVLEHPGAAVVLAVDERDRVLVVRQYRHPVGQRLVELPAGLLDMPGEDPEEAARRELVEEAGYDARSWTHLGSTYSSPGITGEVIHLYLARDLTPADRGDFEPEHEEADMHLLWMPFDDLVRGVLAGRVANAPLINAVLLARARGLVGGTAGG
ncbi:NUDIX domain-containing protein [Nocardioides dilutus]